MQNANQNGLFGFINTSTPTNTLFWATLISGVLDALAAIVVYYAFFKLNPVQIYQFVASGILDKAAYSGGLGTALLGLGIHFLIAFVAAYVFFQLYPNMALLRQNGYAVGLVYGAVIWAFMNLVVIPYLSKIPPAPFDTVAVLGILWHMVLVGLPIVLIVEKYYRQKGELG